MTTTTATAPAHLRPAPGRTRPRHEPEPRPVRRHLRPVPDAPVRVEREARRRLRPHAALGLALAGLFALLFAVALLQTVLVQGQLRLDGLRADITEAQTESQLLRDEVARLSDPEVIRTTAIEQLGMQEQATTTFLNPPPLVSGPTP